MRTRPVPLAVLVVLAAVVAEAVDHPVGHRLSVSRYSSAAVGGQFKLVVRAGEDGNPAQLAVPADPQSGGRFVAVERDGGSFLDPLTAGTWTGLGQPPGSRGWKYRNPGAPAGGAVAVLKISERAVKLVARSTGGMPLPTAGNGDLHAYLQVGANRYCAAAAAPHASEVAGRLVGAEHQPPPPTCSGACAFGPDADGNGVSDCVLPFAVLDQDLIDPSRGREVGARVHYPLTTIGPHPLVLISHGGLGADNGEIVLGHLADAFAAAGYVAVQVGHRASATIEQHRLDRPADVSFLIDALASGALTLPSDFGGTIDTQRVGLTGHSAGAYTTHAAAGASYPYGDLSDPRVAAVVPISPQGVGDVFEAYDDGAGDSTWSTMRLPVLVLLGADEIDVNGLGVFVETDWRLRPFLRYPETSDRLQVILTGQDHLAMGGQGADDVRTFIAQNARAFFDRYLRGRGEACAIGTLLPPATGVDTLARRAAVGGSALAACPAP
jgi:dienelactone hydrolase